jgi:diguanylate cyclase (GGDEF)-like protein
MAVLASNDRLEKHATTDPLTGLPNRGSLERALSDALVRAHEPGGSVGIVLIDVDDFKRVNDTHGHAVGDEVLRHIGEKLRSVVRSTDVAGRWGGEEFLVVLPGEDLVGASSAAEKLVKLVAGSPAPGSGERLTISAGVAVGPLHAGDAVGLVGCADAALYAAKRAGKNCVRIHAPSLGGVPAAWLGDTTELMASLDRPTDPARPDLKGWLCCQLIAPVPLRPGVHVIGREPGCEVVLHHPSVSRRHAQVSVLTDGRILFEDCSRNGSRCNGVVVTGPVELHSGDRLTIGVYDLTLQSGLRPDARVIDTWRVPP